MFQLLSQTIILALCPFTSFCLSHSCHSHVNQGSAYYTPVSSPCWMWRAVFPSIQQSLQSPRLCAPCCTRPSGEALNSCWAMLRAQLRELCEMGSWRRANDYFFEKVWESWSGSVMKTPEGGVLKEFQATWFYNILQLILKWKRLENNLYIQEKKPWGIVFPPWYWHPWPHHLCHQKTHQGSMAGPEPTPPTPPPGKNGDSLSPLVHADLWGDAWVLPHSGRTDSACHLVASRPSPTCLNFWILSFLTGIMVVLKPVSQNFEGGMLKIKEKTISKAPSLYLVYCKYFKLYLMLFWFYTYIIFLPSLILISVVSHFIALFLQHYPPSTAFCLKVPLDSLTLSRTNVPWPDAAFTGSLP